MKLRTKQKDKNNLKDLQSQTMAAMRVDLESDIQSFSHSIFIKQLTLWFVPITVSYLFVSICGNWQQTYTLAKVHDLHSVMEILLFGLMRIWLWPTYGWTLVALGTIPTLIVATFVARLPIDSRTKHLLGISASLAIVLFSVFLWVNSRTNLLQLQIYQMPFYLNFVLVACAGTSIWCVLVVLISWTLYFHLRLN